MPTPRPAAIAFALTLTFFPPLAAAQTVVDLVGEGDFIVGSEFFFVGSTSVPKTNAAGGFATRLHVGSTFGDNYGMNPALADSYLVGRTTRPGVPAFNFLDREEAARLQNTNPADDPAGRVIGSRTYFVTQFGGVDLNDAGDLAFDADVIYDDTAGPSITEFRDRVDSIWFNDAPLVVEGDALTASGLTDRAYTSMGLIGLGESSGVVYRGSYAGGGGSGEALFNQDGSARLGTGDAIGGVAATIDDIGNAGLSRTGASYVAAVVGSDAAAYLVVNGAAATLPGSGDVYVGGALIGLVNGGRTATETLPDGFNRPAAGPGGQWAFSGFTDDGLGDPDGDFDSVIVVNGHVTFREEDVLRNVAGASVTLDGSAADAVFNADGDVLAAYDNALILNGTVIAEVGTAIANDSAALRDFQSGLALSDRDAGGNVQLYFRGRTDSPTSARNNDTTYGIETAFDTGAIAGDLDLNGVLEVEADVCAFAIALLDDFAYVGLYGSAGGARGDFNGDGRVTGADIDGLAALLNIDRSVIDAKIPEPATGLLAASLAGLVLARRRRNDR